MDASTLSAKTLEFVARGTNKPVRYALSDADYAALARAVEFEGAPQLAVAWTLIQRFAYVYPTYKRLQDLVSAYCQPINPAWFPGGKALVQYVTQLRAEGKLGQAALEESKAKRRVWQASFPIERLSANTHNTIARVFASAQSPIPGSVHFRAPLLDTNGKPYTTIEDAADARAAFAKKRGLLDTVRVGDPRSENWFFAEGTSGSTRVATSITRTATIVGALVLISAAALWWATRGAV